MTDQERKAMEMTLDALNKAMPWIYPEEKANLRGVIAALRQALAQPEQDISYTDVQMAELIMSDCGHSSDYTPLLNRIAGRLATYRQALAQPKYRRGDRLLCLESEEYCVIHISGTDRQWVKFSDSQIAVYTNEQVQELFELIPKETDEALAQDEQEPVAWMHPDGKNYRGFTSPLTTFMRNDWTPLYTAPPSKEWVGLSDADLRQIILAAVGVAEAKLKERNK